MIINLLIIFLNYFRENISGEYNIGYAIKITLICAIILDYFENNILQKNMYCP